MEVHELNRMFDKLAPTPEQEQAGLCRLLRTEERKGSPMGKLKKLTAAGIAAALMVIVCAAAAVTGLDQRLSAFFGGGQQAQALLLPGALPVDITAEDSGAVLHITQVLRDRYTVAAAADFTAPEGTVLGGGPGWALEGFGFREGRLGVTFLDGAGEPVENSFSYSWGWHTLEDGDPADNHLSLVFVLDLPEGPERMGDIAALALSLTDLRLQNQSTGERATLWGGDWSVELPLPQADVGRTWQLDRAAGELDGSPVRVGEVYLSPVTLAVTLEREEAFSSDASTEEGAREHQRWNFALDGEHFAAASGREPAIPRAVLTDRAGNEVPLEVLGGSAGLDSENPRYCHLFRLARATDPAQLQGGTLTLRIGDGETEIPLDDLG